MPKKPKIEPLIRLMTEKDLPAVLAIEQEQAFPWSLPSLQSCLSKPYQAFVIAEESKVIGFGVICLAADECEIHNIVITSARRRCGYGRQLLQYLLNAAKQQGTDKIYLEVRSSNSPAQKLYKSMGFKMVRLRKNYYPTVGGCEDAVILSYVANA